MEYEDSPYLVPKDTKLELLVRKEIDVFLILTNISSFYSPEATPVSEKYVTPQIAAWQISLRCKQLSMFIASKVKLSFKSGAYYDA